MWLLALILFTPGRSLALPPLPFLPRSHCRKLLPLTQNSRRTPDPQGREEEQRGGLAQEHRHHRGPGADTHSQGTDRLSWVFSPPSYYCFPALPGRRADASLRNQSWSSGLCLGHRGSAVIQANGAWIIWNSRGSRRNFSLASKHIR